MGHGQLDAGHGVGEVRARLLTSFLNDVQAGMSNVMVLDRVLIVLRVCPDQDGMVLR
jgi:hypothetical protein